MSKYFIQDGMISKFDFMNNQEFYPLTTLCNMLNDNDEKYDKLAEKFVIVSKALGLACVEIQCEDCPLRLHDGECDYTFVGCKIALSNYFTTKAREMIENE